ncbi:GDSL-type esterase/lipase family protein [Jiangella alkaliphila]|uniref:GDSL-like Lipase/Acylhydrolase family protein n=1 Tax=Jiangella alkaliphila TaxID=419479 RepID=A0A1H2K688_9ACTN|nr:GDSL-type esterase/lipase family protein [Jiangella alkaliphila]SDU64234.1 GDSL-like Lipase/Acylhydrolase family protein [Jiangella alkaliphila]
MREGRRSEVDLGPGERPDLWSGAVAWTVDGARRQAWRLPPEEEPFAYAPALYGKARIAAGVRFGASIRARQLEIELVSVGDDAGPADVLVDGRLVLRQRPGPDRLRIELPPRRVRVEAWLPHRGRVEVGSVRATDVVAADSLPSAVRWVAYGSSITQCEGSEGPSQTWPAIVARTLGWDLTCLGFGGECHLDPVVPRTIARLAPGVVSLCLGINVHGRSSFSGRSWQGQAAELIRRVREAHATATIVVSSPIFSAARESTPNGAGLTLGDLREQVHEVGRDFRERGDTGVHVLDGRSLIGPGDAHLLRDGLHPSHDGYRLMAERMVRYLTTAGIASATAQTASAVAVTA